jgi:acetyltransferase-like isoleucine patch superfamily enzyme
MLSNMYFNANEDMFNVFSGFGKYKGFDVLSTANNHSLDQGEEGLIETLQFLDAQNIARVGTARSIEERNQFPILEKNGIKVAFLSYTFSLNALVCPPDKSYLANHLNLNEANPDISLIVAQAKLARQKGAEFIPVCTRVTKGIHTSLGNTFYGLGAAIRTNSVIGDYNYIESEVLIGHDVQIGRYCHIGPRTFIAGDVRIGDFVVIHGAASIARGVQIGHNAVIGLGAVVMRDVPENAVVMGNPAKQIK